MGGIPSDRRPLPPSGANVRQDHQLVAPQHRLGTQGDLLVLVHPSRVDHDRRRPHNGGGIRRDYRHDHHPHANPAAAPTGFTSLIVLILFIGGIQLLCLSVIGSYLAHIYEEVKRRPPYIVAEIRNRPAIRELGGEADDQAVSEEGEPSAVS